jgi:transposase-like protein
MAAQLLKSGRQWREVAAALDVSPTTLRDGLKRRTADIQARVARSGPTPLETYLAALHG